MLGKEVYAWQCYFFSFSYYQCRHKKIVLLFMDILFKMGCYGSQHRKVVFFVLAKNLNQYNYVTVPKIALCVLL